MTIKQTFALVLLFAAVFSPIEGQAQSYPAKPITMIGPYEAGSGGDLVMRQYMVLMQEALKQTIIPENRPGAANSLGTIIASKAAPDGYTILFLGGDSMTPLFGKQFPDVLEIMTPVIQFAKGAFFLIASPSAGADMQAFVRTVKANPGKFNYGWVAATQMLPLEIIKARLQIELTAVPYKSIAQINQAFMQGDVIAYASIPAGLESSLAAKKAGLLVYLDTARNPLFPDVPAATEVGLGNMLTRFSFAVWAPKGTPPQIISHLNTAFNTVVNRPEIEAMLRRQGAQAVGGAPQVHSDSIRASHAFWAEAIKTARYTPPQ